MATELPRILVEVRYHAAAQEYLRKLPLEHFMEATPQATQRKITLESLDLVKAQRSDFHLFNELLVQYPVRGRKMPRQVVPDNMVVLLDGPIDAEGSYDTPLQPAPPFWMLEYVSKWSKRKDYDKNMRKYERQLKVKYYLLFVPEEQELTLYRHTGQKYITVPPNEQGRLALPELELEVGLLGRWVRYWYRGELLPLPADLLRKLQKVQEELQQTHGELRKTQEELQQAEQQRQQAEQQRQQAERQAAEERVGRLAAETELAQVRAELARLTGTKGEGK